MILIRIKTAAVFPTPPRIAVFFFLNQWFNVFFEADPPLFFIQNADPAGLSLR